MKKKRLIDGIFCKMAPGALLLLVALAVPAWGQHLDWAKQAGSSDFLSFDAGSGIAVDSEGNSYVTGYSLTRRPSASERTTKPY